MTIIQLKRYTNAPEVIKMIRIFPTKNEYVWRIEINKVLVMEGNYLDIRPVFDKLKYIIDNGKYCFATKCLDRYTRKRPWKVEYLDNNFIETLLFKTRKPCERIVEQIRHCIEKNKVDIDKKESAGEED